MSADIHDSSPSFPPLVSDAPSEQSLQPASKHFLPAAFRALEHRDFRTLWFGAMTSSTGTWMQTVAQSWLVFTMTGSAFWLGLDTFLAMAPSFLFSMIGGVIADRFDRRRLLLCSQYVQMTCAFTLAMLVYTQQVRVWHILMLTFLTGTAQSFGGPAYMSLLPTLVPREIIPNAVAFNAIQFNLARMIGPALAGIALARFGSVTCFALNGLSFLAVIYSLLNIKTPKSSRKEEKTSIIRGLGQGFSFMGSNPILPQFCVLAFFTTFMGISLGTLLPVFAKTVFHGDAQLYSHLMSCVGLGAVAGGVFVAAASRMKRRGLVMLVGQVTCGLGIALFARSQSLWLGYPLLFVSALSLVTVFALMAGLVQQKVPDEVRGRVMSIFMLSFQSGMSLGGLAAGTLAQRFSPTATLMVEGALLSLMGTTLLVTRSKFSRL